MTTPYAEIDLSELENRSILIVDDNHALHRDYKAVLCPDHVGDSEQKLDELEDLLLGEAPVKAKPKARNFFIQSAFQGEEAYEIVKKHRAKGVRYPLALVDMRMPPGWNGLETIEKLREVDEDMFFVIVTAYSDQSEDEIIDRLGPTTPIRIIYKPYEPKEIYEIAYTFTSKWNAMHVF